MYECKIEKFNPDYLGDKSKIEAGIKTLGYKVKYIDSDGNIIM